LWPLRDINDALLWTCWRRFGLTVEQWGHSVALPEFSKLQRVRGARSTEALQHHKTAPEDEYVDFGFIIKLYGERAASLYVMCLLLSCATPSPH
jgi:hypothetical protein